LGSREGGVYSKSISHMLTSQAVQVHISLVTSQSQAQVLTSHHITSRTREGQKAEEIVRVFNSVIISSLMRHHHPLVSKSNLILHPHQSSLHIHHTQSIFSNPSIPPSQCRSRSNQTSQIPKSKKPLLATSPEVSQSRDSQFHVVYMYMCKSKPPQKAAGKTSRERSMLVNGSETPGDTYP
jgi:hypothetical protein